MAASTRPAKNRFLDVLPLELRDKIFRLALVDHAPIDTSDAILVAKRHNASKWRARRDGQAPPPPPNDAVNAQYPRLQPALLATCRQIYYEAYAIYYTENTFLVEMATQLGPFINTLHPDTALAMKPIRVLTPPIDSWPQLQFFFGAIADNYVERLLCALPVKVEGEGTVYMTERQTRYFEEVQVTKVMDHGYGPFLGKAYVVRRKA